MEQKRVFVTGMGVVCAVGSKVDELFTSLTAGTSGISKPSILTTRHSDIPVAEVPYTDGQFAVMAGVSQGSASRASLLALVAATQAMQGFEGADRSTFGLVCSTTVGGADINDRLYWELKQSTDFKEYSDSLDAADCAHRLAKRFGIYRNVDTISTACSSSANAIAEGARMIRQGLAQRVLVGGADALTRFTLNGFNSLELLSPTGCRPFDAQRDGVTLGEGAAFLVLESSEVANPSNILCQLAGYANRNDAFHQTSSSPTGYGASLAMQQALGMAGVQPSAIGYINAHGTGTLVNDLSEGRAIENVFGTSIPPISSTKGYTGHTLAAAGAIEAIISILSITKGLLPQNIGFRNRMEELHFTPVRQSTQGDAVRSVLSNSFGFGGNNVSLVFSHV